MRRRRESCSSVGDELDTGDDGDDDEDGTVRVSLGLPTDGKYSAIT